ncbi:hypothetical protein REPUB_Repub09cG0081200 [Reevesia pubescens]
MASPNSHSEKNRKDNYNLPSTEEDQPAKYNLPSTEEDQPAKDKDWLELGLGFSIACRKQEEDQEHQPNPNISVSASASNSQFQAKQKLPGCCSAGGLELGLSLGIDLESRAPGCLELLDDDDDDYEHEHGFLRVIDMVPPGGNYDQNLCQKQDDDDDDDDMAWWPCDMNLGLDDWQMPVPNNSHDYFTRTRPNSHSGLWFTLQSYTNR